MFEIKKINAQNIEAVFKLYQKINLYNKSSVTFLETMKKPYHIGFCGYMDNALSSFISAIHVLDEIDIIEIGVIKEQRRRGIAYKLISRLQKHCIKNGIRKIFLGVAENNIAAISLYEKTGFNKIGIRKNYYFRDGFSSNSYEYSWKVKR
jgi:ribosomal protein S18 acetylase RimI-like enzyme